jgi:DNA polymerase-3 subunit gamma/tau
LSYTVLARRYRSTTFEDIVGQEPIAKTLRNAIDSNRTAHAYLFSGTRGVGKTSMARIFARELNRSGNLSEEDAIGDAVLRGEDLDVIEIDGASNRGVNEARDLIAASGLAPTRCKYRIYIIDEVHMLTTPAFNALLKTMEEPPSHVKFILCTTEPHKVPATIQSRCQRFDFRAIPSAKIATHLSFVLEKEGIKAEPEVVAEVSRIGNGSMRDALSVLDRLLSSGAQEIKLTDMEELLGLPSQKAITSLCIAISQCNLENAFQASDELICSGISLDRVLEVLANSLRNALVSIVCGGNSNILELSDEGLKEAAAIGAALDEGVLTHMIALCDASSRQVRRAGSGRALFDATLARLCMSGQLAEAGNVLSSSTSVTKKKRETKPVAARLELAAKEVDNSKGSSVANGKDEKKPLTWELMKTTISSTAGLKRIASYLEFVSFKDGHLDLLINESGRDSTNYVMAQRQKIEEVLSSAHSKSIKLSIANSTDNQPEIDTSSLEAVNGNELVDTARGLFDGTVVQVKQVSKDDK